MMTTNQETLSRPAQPTPLLRLEGITKRYRSVSALEDITLNANAGEVTCVLGDNGAGKSTLIKVMAGRHLHTAGKLYISGEELQLTSPRHALNLGISTVFQDLALIPLMSVWRNFFLGSELTKGRGPLRRLDISAMRSTACERLAELGIIIPDPDVPVASMSGGQRQCIAIARAIYLGARVLILDEPTAALGVKQSGVVLKYIAAARDAGIAVVLITHNPHHAFMVGNHFVLLNRGRMVLDCARSELTVDQLATEMAGGAELSALEHELRTAKVDYAS